MSASVVFDEIAPAYFVLQHVLGSPLKEVLFVKEAFLFGDVIFRCVYM